MSSRRIENGLRAIVAVLASLPIGACQRQTEQPQPTTAGQAVKEPAPQDTPAIESRPAARGDEALQEQRRLIMVAQTIAARGDVGEPVMAVMRKVPRHRFVLQGLRDQAYDDAPLPIVGGQTISQPYIVALMTDRAQIKAGDRCLEIGTGSGYQAAVLAELCAKVYSIEYLPEVAAFAETNLRNSGYLARGIELRVGDGYKGWPEAAPFDVIVVTAAPEKVPAPLLEQLSVGGRLLIPVGPNGQVQVLERWTRVAAGSSDKAFKTERLLDVRFVPFLGQGAQ